MAIITVNIQVSQTVSTLDAATIAGVIAWVQTNIVAKLPSGASITYPITVQVTP